jgi:hypothetical protein
MQEVVERFVPVEVVSQLAERRMGDDLLRHGRPNFGVCLATDAGSYTALAEFMDPMALPSNSKTRAGMNMTLIRYSPYTLPRRRGNAPADA